MDRLAGIYETVSREVAPLIAALSIGASESVFWILSDTDGQVAASAIDADDVNLPSKIAADLVRDGAHGGAHIAYHPDKALIYATCAGGGASALTTDVRSATVHRDGKAVSLGPWQFLV